MEEEYISKRENKAFWNSDTSDYEQSSSDSDDNDGIPEEDEASIIYDIKKNSKMKEKPPAKKEEPFPIEVEYEEEQFSLAKNFVTIAETEARNKNLVRESG